LKFWKELRLYFWVWVYMLTGTSKSREKTIEYFKKIDEEF